MAIASDKCRYLANRSCTSHEFWSRPLPGHAILNAGSDDLLVESKSTLDSWLNVPITSSELSELAEQDKERDHSSTQLSHRLTGQQSAEARYDRE